RELLVSCRRLHRATAIAAQEREAMRIRCAAVGCCLLVACAAPPPLVCPVPSAAPQQGGDLANEANRSKKPLSTSPSANAQDYYAASLYDSDKYTNDLLLRGVLPVMSTEVIPAPQLLRLTVPLSTRPDFTGGGYETGLGDINLLDILLLQREGTQLGLGPLVT